MNRIWKLNIILSFAGLLWCVAVGLLLWFIPLGSSVTESSPGTVMTGGVQSFASISALGPVPLIAPVVLAAIGAWSAYRRHTLVLVVATAVIGLFAALTGFSIGFAYVPAVAALVAASVVALTSSDGQSRVSARRGPSL